ncbi:hypothetical protein TIFTF001_016735 [Ficus carica]|uniref:Transposase n=1 Tax=Ficus carica TaxID=3494 RepID=A0AA88DIW6_FICCA|nr:hypothetical protein TIFTF001_016735 [Ficus carica]
MIKLMNPGTVTRLVVDKDQRSKYLFITLGACIAMRKVKVKDIVASKFMKVTAAYSEHEFNRLYDDLKNRYSVAAEYLDDHVDVRKWARCHFTESRYNILTINGAESINSVLKKARTYP